MGEYYYYRKCDAAERAKYLSDTDSGRAVGIRKALGEHFRLKDASEDNNVRDAGKLFHVHAAATGKTRSPTVERLVSVDL